MGSSSVHQLSHTENHLTASQTGNWLTSSRKEEKVNLLVEEHLVKKKLKLNLDLKMKVWMMMMVNLYQNPSLEDQHVVDHLVHLVQDHLVQDHLVQCRDRDTVLDHLVEEVVEEGHLAEASKRKKEKSSAEGSRNVQ